MTLSIYVLVIPSLKFKKALKEYKMNQNTMLLAVILFFIYEKKTY